MVKGEFFNHYNPLHAMPIFKVKFSFHEIKNVHTTDECRGSETSMIRSHTVINLLCCTTCVDKVNQIRVYSGRFLYRQLCFLVLQTDVIVPAFERRIQNKVTFRVGMLRPIIANVKIDSINVDMHRRFTYRVLNEKLVRRR